MIASRTAGQVEARSKVTAVEINPSAIEHAVRLIRQVCCFAGSFDLLDEFRDEDLSVAIEQHDTAALFDRLLYDFSFQGISDEIAANYMAQTWPSDVPLSPEKSGQTANLPEAANLLGFS